MPKYFCQDGGDPEIDFANDQEQDFFEYLVEYYDGDYDAATEDFYRIVRSEENPYLNNENLSTKVIEGFTPEQQRSVVDTLKSFFFRSLNNDKVKRDGKPKIGIIENRIRSYFSNVLRDKFSDDLYRSAKLQEILDNWDDFWNMAHDSLTSMGIEIDDNGFVLDTSGIDATRRNWDDQVVYTVNEKDTASTRVKLALSFVPKARFKRDENGELMRGEDDLPLTEKDNNFLGMNEYASMDSIYDKMSELLSDHLPSGNVEDTYQNFIEHLKNQSEKNPQMLEAIRQLQSYEDNYEFQADFVNTFGKAYAEHQTTLLSPVVSQGRFGTSQIGYNLSPFDSNRTSQIQKVKEDWIEDQKLLDIVRQDEENELIIDQSAVEDIRDEYKNRMQDHLQDGNIDDLQAIRIVRDALLDLGINIREETLEYISQNPDSIGDTSWKFHVRPDNLNKKSMMGYIFNAFLRTADNKNQGINDTDIEEHGKLGLNNPLQGRDSQGIVNRLAKVESQHRPRLYTNSFRNTEGNNVHPVHDHSSLTREFARLRRNPDAATRNRGAYDSTSEILKSIEENRAEIRDVLHLSFTDGLKRKNRGQGSPHQNMSTSEKELFRLSHFQGTQRNDRVNLVSPTLSDKSRDYIITLPQIHSLFGENRWIPINDPSTITEDGTLDIDPRGLEGEVLLKSAMGEWNRIMRIQGQMDEGVRPEDHPLGDDYMWEGQFFYHFPELNPGSLGDDVNELWVEDTINGNSVYRLKNTDQAKEFAKQALVDKLVEKVEGTKERWIDQGIVPDTNNHNTWLMDRTYLKKINPYNLTDTDRLLAYAALDYQLSQRFFNSEITKILAGDPALHVKQQRNPREQANKVSKREDVETINESLVNLEKRFANHIAPFITQNVGRHDNDPDLENTTEVKIATVNDRLIDSKHIDQYEELFREQLGNEDLANAYRNIESTDAQEYATLREFTRTKFLNGEISKDLHDKIINRVDEAQSNNSRQNFFKLSSFLTEDEINSLLYTPHKDIYVGRKYYNHLNLTNWIYRKTSSIPLIPEVTDGTDLNNLRLAMEGDKVGESRIDRVAYQSADKTGAYNTFDVFDESDGRKRFKDLEDLENQIVTQADVANSASDATLNDLNVQTVSRQGLGLQFQIPKKDKMSITRVSQMDKMLTINVKNTEGFSVPWRDDTVDGAELERMKQERISRIWDLGRQELENELNLEITTNDAGERTIRYDNKEALQEMLQNEAEERDWGPAAIDSIQLDEDGEFTLPFSFSPASSSIESLLLSIVEDRTVGQEMPGKSYVQVSGAGWHDISKRSSIATTSNFDPEVGLKHARIEDGEVKPSQVFIQWDFRDEDGNILPMDNYVDEDGNIDDSKLDPELRNLIGARIPNQGPNSMLPMEVVGFLPPTHDKTMVVTDEIVAQMGSDFDVDKIFSYRDEYQVETDEDGNPTNIRLKDTDDTGFGEREQLKREYKQIHWSALTNPETLARVLKPLDMDYLSNEADRIQNLKKPQDQVVDYLDPHQQVDNHNAQHAGKALIGITSLASNFNSMLELYPQKMTAPKEDAGPNEPNQIPRTIKFRTEDGTQSLDQVGGTGATIEMPDGSEAPISDAIMMYQNGAVDNAKELILNKLNATTNTIEVMMATIMMNDGSQGISLAQSSRFFAQEIISMYDEEIDKIEGQTNDEYYSENSEDIAYNRVVERVLSNFDNSEEIKNQYLQRLGSLQSENERTDAYIPPVDELNENLDKANTGAIEEDVEYAIDQLSYLRSFKRLENIANTLVGIRSAVNFGDRNGPGKSLLHARNKLDDYNHLDDNLVFMDASDIVKDGEWKSAAENTFKFAWEMYGKSTGKDNPLFYYDTEVFDFVESELEQITGDQIGPEKALSIFRELRSMVFTSDTMFDNVEGERSKLLHGTENVDDIATRVKKAQQSWGNQSFFISRLRPQLPDGEGDIGTILFSADKTERTDDIRIIQDLAGLLNSNNPEKRLLAEDLVKYSYIVSGGVQTPTSFTNYVPMGYLMEGLNIKETIDNFDFNNEIGDTTYRFKEQYFQHNPSDAHTLNDDEIDKVRSKGKIPPKINTDKNDNILKRLSPDGMSKEPIPFVAMYDTSDGKWRLYQYNDGFHYEIDTLGKANDGGYNTVEYNVNKDKRINSSQIESHRTRLDYNPFRRNENTGSSAVDNMNDRTKSIDEIINVGTSEISAEKFYDSVQENEEDPYVKKLADLMRDLDTDFRVRFAPQDANMFSDTSDAYYGGGDTLWVSKELRKDSRNDSTRAILHELIHKQTYSLQQKGEENRTEEQNKLISNLHSLFKNTIDKTDPSEFGLARGMSRDPNEVSEELYKGYSLQEFLAYGLANKRGQEYLNSVTLEGESESVFDQIVNTVKELIQTIAEGISLDVGDNSALAYTIEDTIRLFEETKQQKNQKENPESQSKSDVESEGDFIDDLQNELDEDIDLSQRFNQDLNNAKNRDASSLKQSVGEFRRGLSDRKKEVFDQIRNRIQTKC